MTERESKTQDCRVCKKQCALELFQHTGSKFGHHMKWCKPCYDEKERARGKQRYAKAKANPPPQKPPVSQPTECKNCHKIKAAVNFAHTRQKMRLWCIECLHERQNEWRKASVDRKKQLCVSNANDKIKCTKCQQIFPRHQIIPGRQRCKKCQRKYYEEWLKTTPKGQQAMIGQALRAEARALLKRTSNLDEYVDWIGCTVLEFQRHIAKQYKPGMTDANYGYGKNCWHIDHIIPLSTFDLTNMLERNQATHYTNVQPLWQTDNLSSKRVQDNKLYKKRTFTEMNVSSEEDLYEEHKAEHKE